MEEEVNLKIRHFALLIVTIIIIVFMQPLVLLLGNIALLTSVFAFIYSDLPPEKQEAWENRIVQFLKQLRSSLKNRTRRTKDLGNVGNRPSTEIVASTNQTSRQTTPRLEENFDNRRQVNINLSTADKVSSRESNRR
jgi:hypothetical protein